MKTFRQFAQEETITPSNSLGLTRGQMPQILAADVPEFLSYLQKHGVSHYNQTVKAATLKPTQKEINGDKVRSLAASKVGRTTKPSRVLVSKDGFILDGHHRWQNLAWKDENMDIVRVSVGIQKLLQLAADFPQTSFTAIDHYHQPQHSFAATN